MSAAKAPTIVLNQDQARAEAEIDLINQPQTKHLLEGEAGTGKTSLVIEVVRKMLARKQTVVATAPTHKAVAVIRRKLREAGIKDDEAPCTTVQSLLELKPEPQTDRLVFKRAKYANPVMQRNVVIDECSMLGSDLMNHVRRCLPYSFVLFVGDEAQLPPVGEKLSESFLTKSKSRLSQIMRQGEGNPILEATHYIRERQGTDDFDFDWAVQKIGPCGKKGIFLPDRTRIPNWVAKAFQRDTFDNDPDGFRYLAWTNAKVAYVNKFVRELRYGFDLPTPFMPGERVLFRSHLMLDEEPIFDNSEEATCCSMVLDSFAFKVKGSKKLEAWEARVPAWRMNLIRDDGVEVEVHMPADADARLRVEDRIRDEAIRAQDEGDKSSAGLRWKSFHAFRGALADVGHIYALTVHKAQGSTFRRAFVDFEDIERCGNKNPLEMQRLFYTALTRASDAVILNKRA